MAGTVFESMRPFEVPVPIAGVSRGHVRTSIVGEASSQGECCERSSCSFFQTVTKRPTLLVRYASMHRYCRGGDHARCARFRALRSLGAPSANLLPSGELDATLTGRAERVLVVDDVPVFLSLSEGMVAAQVPGAEVVGTSHPADALELLQRERFDLVVSDFHMPEMDGRELVEQIRRRAVLDSVPVIVLTTEESSESREAVLAHSRTRWVNKGPERASFASAVRELLYEGRV